MTILVTGGSGFVGAALVDALVGRGERVVAVDRAPSLDAVPPGPGSLVFREADVTQPGALDEILSSERVDQLVIGAAVTADAARERADPAGIVAVNVGAVADAVRAAAAHGVRRVLYLGSVAVYGDGGPGPGPLVEDMTPLRPRSLYAITKQAGEATALRLGDTFGLPVVAVRLGTCFGPYERETGSRDTLSAPYQVLQLAQAGKAAHLSRPARRDWLYVRDAVAALVALLDRPDLPHRLYNVAAGFEWTLAQWCEHVAAACPGFTWSVDGPEAPNVELYGAVDRAPVGIGRILADTGYRPAFDLPAVVEDFLRPHSPAR